ncbi:MAG: substrate-binding periplasmic protein [Lachnospira sp.]
MKYWIKRSVLPFGIVCLMSMALCGCGREKKEAVTVQPELVIGSDDYEPYNYQNENGDYAGVDVELAKEACRRIGYTPVFKQIQWDDKDIYLENGEVDCAWGSFSMDGREDDYIWVGPYMYSREVVMVRTDSDIYKLDDLAGKNVAVRSKYTQPEQRIFRARVAIPIPKVKNVYSFVEMNELFLLHCARDTLMPVRDMRL